MTEEILQGWNIERVSVFAPDDRTAQAGGKLGFVRDWKTLGHNGEGAWGEFQGSASKPYQIKLDLGRLRRGESGLGCSCPSRKQPCKHALGLLYLIVKTPDAVPYGEAPEYVQTWLEKAADRAQKAQEKEQATVSKSPDPEQQNKTIIQRKRKIMAGLEELELWLDNLIRHGLGDPQVQNYEFWEAKAARMVDAQASGIATWLRDMGKIPQRGSPAWIEDLLEQLGKLHLFIEGFKRFDDLSPEVQSDLRTVAGWHLKRSDLADETGIEDEWLVLGKYETTVDDRLRTQRIWLRGIKTGKSALIREFIFGEQPFETQLQPGWLIHAELTYFPSAYPLRAFVRHQHGEPSDGQKIVGETIRQSVEGFSQALSRNPWLPQFPFLLEAVIPVRYAEQWILREVDGVYLPIAENFEQRWSLLALSGGHPIQVVGEWDGVCFLPTGAIAEGRFVDFNLIGKL